jgi:hypothetical protein
MPCVQFDALDLVGCRDVTTAEFAAANPGEKLIEARFHISSLVRLGSEESLIQYLYIVHSPERTLRVVDHQPKTLLDTSISGRVAVEKTRGHNNNLALNASGGLHHSLTADATASQGTTSTDAMRYELLPPLNLLAASGTLSRGAGAYFKLKPSQRTSLEGEKEFAIIARVPQSWRGDCLRVHCRAYGAGRGIGRSGADLVCGSAAFAVALYLDGDEESKAAAETLLRTERQLRELVQLRAREIEDRRFPTLGHKIGAALSVIEPKFPDGWLDQVVNSPSDAAQLAFSRYLPTDVRSAVMAFREARLRLHKLGDGKELGSSPAL